jgi:hypothetical protein
MTSRVIARLDCQLTFDGNSCDAVIVDISLEGALISSKFLPPKNADVTLIVQTPLLKKTLLLEGRVIRGNWGMSDHGKLGRFAIKFSRTSLEVIKLINQLNS